MDGAVPRITYDIPRLLADYTQVVPDPANPAQRVAFGTSGHRGTSSRGSFNEAHILAIAQAVAELRAGFGATGPLFIGMDTHALAAPAHRTALEVLAANGVQVVRAADDRPTPTPVISRAILAFNADRTAGFADGLILTPSHNPPEDGGIKYNPPSGGPAEETITRAIQERANALLEQGNREVLRMPYERALRVENVHTEDLLAGYVEALAEVLDLGAVAAAGVNIGADPLGGSAIDAWGRIAERYRLRLTVVNERLDPAFSFVPPDHDGRIRMDCSSPWAMARLLDIQDRFDIAFATDPDADRHGIVAPGHGLLNPNHYLAVCAEYLFSARTGWPKDAALGRTVVTSHLLDRVAAAQGRAVFEPPVGFKWYVEGLLERRLAFAGEESAGASLLTRDGGTWTTDKDGITLCLLAAEILARTGKNPGTLYQQITEVLGSAYYRRADMPVNREQKKALSALSEERITATELAGEPIRCVRTRASGNNQPFGGIKVETEHGWFAVRPSGTEDVAKVYAESSLSEEHREQIIAEAQAVLKEALG